MTLDYAGEWNKSKIYDKNDVVRIGGSTWICTTDKYREDNRFGWNYKPEHDKEGGTIYLWLYLDWLVDGWGEYYPGDINYNGEQGACKHW